MSAVELEAATASTLGTGSPSREAPARSATQAVTAPAATGQLWALFLRELSGFFYSPMSYLVWAVFLVASGYLFVTPLRDGGQASLGASLVSMAMLLLFVTPLLTMRLVAEELRLGTFEILLTDPVGELVIVLSKYAASLVFLACVLLPTVAYPFALAKLGQVDPGPVLTGYLGLFTLGALFAAVGLCASALTSNQIAAGALSFTVLFVFWALGRAADAMGPGTARDVLEYLSAYSRFAAFRRGVVDTRSLVYCFSLVALALFAAAHAVGLRRLR